MTKSNARRYLLIVAVAGLALICFSPTIVQAQTGMSVTIPFDFYVGTQKLPAGSYEVTHPAEPLLRLYDGNKHVSTVFSNGVTNKSAPPNGQLIFNRYGDNYFLSEVRWIGSEKARQLLKSKLEIEIARNNAIEKVVARTK